MVFLPIASSPISNDYGHVFQIICEIERDGQMTHEVLCDKYFANLWRGDQPVPRIGLRSLEDWKWTFHKQRVVLQTFII